MKLIMALVDFSDVTSDIVSLAGRLARALDCKLLLLHVAMPESDFVGGRERTDLSRQASAGRLRHARHSLEILKTEMAKLGIHATASLVISESFRGNPVGKLLGEINRHAPDLIVMGSHGHGALHQLLVGSVTSAVVRRIHSPVLLVPSKHKSRHRAPAQAGEDAVNESFIRPRPSELPRP